MSINSHLPNLIQVHLFKTILQDNASSQGSGKRVIRDLHLGLNEVLHRLLYNNKTNSAILYK